MSARIAAAMCRARRMMRSCFLPRFLLANFFYTLMFCNVRSEYSYNPPIEIQLWDRGRSRLDFMVDVTNSFALKVLAEHNFLNDNNIAFSPYGLTGIMVALYEGVDGDSSFQIQEGMQLPWNRMVVRIGFRDIHRTLKTYFVPEEGFLAGLALNNENVTFNEDYKKILRFYGFDLKTDSSPTPAPESTDSPVTVTSVATESGNKPSLDTTTKEGKEMESNLTAVTQDTTTIKIVDVDITTAAVTTVPTTTPLTTTQNIEDRTEPTTGASLQETTPESAVETIKTTTQSSTDITDTPQETESIIESTTDSIVIDTTTSTTSSSNSETTTSESSNEKEMLPTTEQPEKTTDVTTISNDIEATTTVVEILERKKKSLTDYVYETPSHVEDFLVLRSFDIPSKPNVINEKIFLANGLTSVQVEYMHYDTILDHAYLPHLEASALRLPLDSDRYYLLIILPDRPGVTDLSRLIARLAREYDLGDVRAEMRPRRVRAMVPSFYVKGHVALTTDLQKLGIRDVFEPRQRDFTPMTSQPGVYVRSIEQTVSVAIRKYQPDGKKDRYYAQQPPVDFMASYPFLYFVMDSTIHVSLMAGKLVDPLNSRLL